MLTDNQDLQESILKLEKSISRLDKRIKTQTSFGRNFSLALVRGFGGIVGATVIFGLILALIIQVVRSIDYIPLINNILNSEAIENIINRFAQF